MSPDSLDDVPATPPSPAPVAATLPVAGVVPFSSVDWPGKLVATVFLQGCPWRCPYCHNPGLQPAAVVSRAVDGSEDGGGGSDGGGGWRGVLDLLESRRGLLDGVVFTGGEPTMHRSLGAAIDEVRCLGFGVGLHTSGCYPAALERLLHDHRPDWIGLDIKADPRNAEAYAQIAYGAAHFKRTALDVGGEHVTAARLSHAQLTAARLGAGDKVLRSLGMIIEAMQWAAQLAMQSAMQPATKPAMQPPPAGGSPFAPLSLEVRTTVWPDSPAVAGLPGIADTITDTLAATIAATTAATAIDPTHAISTAPMLTWAIQKARPDGVSPATATAPNVATATATYTATAETGDVAFRADRPGWAAEFDALVDDARAQLRGTGVAVIGR